jgi:hypothetical protein
MTAAALLVDAFLITYFRLGEAGFVSASRVMGNPATSVPSRLRAVVDLAPMLGERVAHR